MKLGKRQRAALRIANTDGVVVAGPGEDVPLSVCKSLVAKGLLAAAPPPFSHCFVATPEGAKVT